MIYPNDFEYKIGFNNLRDFLLNHCESDMGKKYVSEISFSSDFNTIETLLNQTKEFVSIIQGGVAFPIGTLYNVNLWLNQIRTEGSYLNAERMHKLKSMLYNIDSVNKFFIYAGEEKTKPYPYLSRAFAAINVFPDIETEISRCITEFGSVSDTASPELYEVRKELRAATGDVNKAMRRVLEHAVNKGIVDKDTVPALRDGRMVIPINAANKRSINGIVHDSSATGKTVFVEPVEVVEAANRIKHLEIRQQEEEIIVLKKLAAIIRPHIDDLLDSILALGRLDFIRAKALLAISLNAQLPVLEKKPEIDWYHALNPQLVMSLKNTDRHPVAMNLQLNREKRILLISGPNAGGKSVALKTVAIIQYMMQCGLLPVLYSNSHMGIFKDILIDIGDEQSIENDLSTYSSHLKNMKKFVSVANKNTLVLADEIGSGTEPNIGGALAQAILEELGNSGCFGVITTHYQNLKTFADECDGFVNGAMLYDRQRLKPLYQLEIGNPGSSFALDIASNIGMPAKIIDAAKNLVGSDYVDNEKYLLDIARDRRYWHNKRINIREKEGKLNDILEKYEEMAAKLKSQRAEILANARREAAELLKGANAKLENTIHEIRKADAERDRTLQLRKELNEFKNKLEQDSVADERTMPKALKPLKHTSRNKKKESIKSEQFKGKIEVGTYVKMKDGNVVGEVLKIDSKRAEVSFGNLRTMVDIDKVIVATAPKKEDKPTRHIVEDSQSNESRNRQLNFNRQLDIRGLRTDEALQAVIYFIDDAVQFNASKVRILHGTGNGILKPRIRQLLKTIPDVVNFYDEDIRFGGAGITVVDLV